MVGPFTSFPAAFVVVSQKIWDGLPEDIQQILIEEGAKQELEALRLAPVQNDLALPKILDAGMELLELSPELQKVVFEGSITARMIPNWVKRVGGVDTPEVRLFNEKLAPIAGVKINPDGTVSRIE